MTLISDSEMAALRAVARSGMVTSVMVLRRTIVETESGQADSWPTSGPVYQGWLYEMTAPSTAISINAGEQIISEFFRLLLPVGTDVLSGDHVLIGGLYYTVEHTNSDSTYLPDLNCALRRIE